MPPISRSSLSSTFRPRYSNFAESRYFSALTLTTVGYGDVIAVNNWLRPLCPIQALIGFGLLTAAVSWFMQIYPALARRRALSIRLTLLRPSGYGSHIEDLETATLSRTLDPLAADIVQIRVDFTQTAESYYFRDPPPGLHLLHRSPTPWKSLNGPAPRSGWKFVQVGQYCRGALDDLAGFLSEEFLTTGESTEDTFRSYASDHKYSYN